MYPTDDDKITGVLVAMIVIIACFMVMIFLVFTRCAPVGIVPACTDYCLLEASVAQNQNLEVKIVVGKTKGGNTHATAMYKKNGQWFDVRYDYINDVVLLSDSADELVRIDRVYSPAEYISYRRRWNFDLDIKEYKE